MDFGNLENKTTINRSTVQSKLQMPKNRFTEEERQINNLRLNQAAARLSIEEYTRQSEHNHDSYIQTIISYQQYITTKERLENQIATAQASIVRDQAKIDVLIDKIEERALHENTHRLGKKEIPYRFPQTTQKKSKPRVSTKKRRGRSRSSSKKKSRTTKSRKRK